jgi:hypothetical protein
MQSQPLPTLILILTLFFALIALIFYLLTLERALKKCAPASRTIEPWKVWLTLIPLFGLIWHFVIVVNVAKSLGNEFARLGISCPEWAPGLAIGLAACICDCGFYLPLVGRYAAVAGFVLWLVYWKRIANYSRDLDANNTIAPADRDASRGFQS